MVFNYKGNLGIIVIMIIMRIMKIIIIIVKPGKFRILRKDKTVISEKKWNFFRSRMTKRTLPLESFHEI